MMKMAVSTSPTGLDPTCTESMDYGGKTQDYKFLCSPLARGSYVTVILIGNNVTLVLCQVVVKTIGEFHVVISLLLLCKQSFRIIWRIQYEYSLKIIGLASQFLTAENFSE